jgi:hypothetical protein
VSEPHGLEAVYERYDRVTREALAVASLATRLKPVEATEVLDMARRYVDDSAYLRKRGDLPRALAALAYAHGWLDAGARLKLFIVTDARLFTVDEQM